MINSFERITAVLLRHAYLLVTSWPRLLDAVYWPTIQMIMWGFLSQYIAAGNGSTVSYALGTFLGAVLLWDALFRVQVGMLLAYLEEIWSRNLGHLFISPPRPHEWWISTMLFGVFRMAIGLLPALLLAIPFYGFSIFDLGVPMVLFFANLTLMGWWIGFFMAAILLRTGPGAENLVWAITFLLSPFCAVYYPVSILPIWLQHFAHIIPATYVFEGLRELVQQKTFNGFYMWKAFGLNLFYLFLGILTLQRAFHSAREKGQLLQTGE